MLSSGGDWHAALRCALDAAEQKLVLGEFATMSLCLGAAEIALAHLGALEASAVLYGVRDIRPLWADDFLDQFPRAEPALVDGLGADSFAALRARGASMSYPDLVAYLRVEATRVLDES